MRILLLLIAVVAAGPLHGAVGDDLWESFVNPPSEARTKVWWFHGETPSTRRGIDADLEEFKAKGVGGVVYYDQVHGPGDGASPAMSAEWWDMLKYAGRRAAELGLTFEVAASNGYVAGGPWITPALGMKRTHCTDTLVRADARGCLAVDFGPMPAGYGDIATVMWPDDPALKPLAVMPGTVTLTGGEPWVLEVELPRGFAVSAVSYTVNGRGKGSTSSMNVPGAPSGRYFAAKYVGLPPLGQLEVSADGGANWRTACSLLPVDGAIGHKSRRRSISFPPMYGSKARIAIHDWVDSLGQNSKLTIGGITLHCRAMVDNLEEKTGLRTEVTYPHDDGGDGAAGTVPFESVRDVSYALLPRGTLWLESLTPGAWYRVVRAGYVPTGARTKHGRKNLLGLEADVMDARAATLHYQHYFKAIADTLRAAGIPVAGMCMDSHEAGIQNWTCGFERLFADSRGYEINLWLPALAGYVVDSRETTDRVLADLRRTVAETIATGFYGTLAALCSRDGYTFTSQAMLNIDNDNIMSGGQAHKPQGEFWAYQTDGNYDVLDAASSAHLYGRPIASAEAFTDTPYTAAWDELLRLANLAYCRGINEFAVCASSHQPWADRPYDDSGSAHPYVFHRHHPRWASSGPFWDYQARCAWMLRQGAPAIDLCVYLGEALPSKTMAYRLPLVSGGYTFDVCTSDALHTRLQAVPGGRIGVRGGVPYKALLVEERAALGPQSALRLAQLARLGAKVVRCAAMTDAAPVLDSLGVAPSLGNMGPLQYTRRILPDGTDMYFVYNHSGRPVSRRALLPGGSQRAAGAWLWDPSALTRTPFDGTLCLAPWQALFMLVPPAE